MNKIAACVILGDAYDKEEFTRTIKSLRVMEVDKLFIAYNGKRGFPSINWISVLCKEIGLELRIRQFEWNDDFGKARQESFEMVPKKDFDWVFWLDTDDELSSDTGETLKDIAEECPPQAVGVFLKYNYAIEPETGIVVVEQWRERLMRANVEWRWMHPIHEVCLAPPGSTFTRLNGVYVNHLRTSGEERNSRERNRKIISKARREHPDVPRYAFYLAGETMAEADAKSDPDERATLARAAILAFTDFKELLGDINDDFFVAQIRIAECFRMAGQFVEAFDADLESIAIYPSWPDGYIGAAKSCMEMGDFSRMLAFADIATKLGKPDTSASIESMNSTFTPLFLRAIAQENLGNLDQAIEDYEASMKFWNPPNDRIPDKLAELRARLNETPVVDKTVDDRKRLFSSKPDKSIAFVTAPIPEDWHPELMAQSGSGGAELCIMKIAPHFVADGWRVSVFGSPGQHKGVYQDGVEYWESSDYVPNEKFKVLVSSRTPVPFKSKLNAEHTLLWMHDVSIGPPFFEIQDIPGRVIALTPWHKKHLQRLYGLSNDRIAVIPNGIDLSRFPADYSDTGELGTSFIWSSSYDRGLEQVLAIWPTIKKNLPDATLDVFYGWNMFERSMENWKNINTLQSDAMQGFMNKINQGMQQDGITHHGRVNQDTLAEHMLGADIWPYMTSFMETFCITAIEMQAAGVLPVASRLAALTDNVAVKGLTIDGWSANVSYQNEFIDILENVYTAEPDQILGARQEGRKLAESFSWDNSYYSWRETLSEMGVN